MAIPNKNRNFTPRITIIKEKVEVMLLTSNTTQNRVIPYWNEIKKLSRQDRSESDLALQDLTEFVLRHP